MEILRNDVDEECSDDGWVHGLFGWWRSLLLCRWFVSTKRSSTTHSIPDFIFSLCRFLEIGCPFQQDQVTEVFGGLVDDVGAAGGAAGVGTEGDREWWVGKR